MAGRKSKVLFDSVDLQILNLLSRGEYGVLEITRTIGLTHQNTKKHLEKLLKANLITKGSGFHNDNKIRLTTVISKPFNDFHHDLIQMGDIDKNEIVKLQEDFRIFLKKLQETMDIEYAKETISEITTELKTNKGVVKKKVKK